MRQIPPIRLKSAYFKAIEDEIQRLFDALWNRSCLWRWRQRACVHHGIRKAIGNKHDLFAI